MFPFFGMQYPVLSFFFLNQQLLYLDLLLLTRNLLQNYVLSISDM